MIDAKLVAKDATKTLHYLRGQGYLWQEVENLLSARYRLLDEVDIYLCLSA